MGSEFFLATLFNLGMNLIYTLVALFIGIFALQFIDKKLLKSIDADTEIFKGARGKRAGRRTVLVPAKT
jgi:hypothetical protein